MYIYFITGPNQGFGSLVALGERKPIQDVSTL